MSADDLAAMIRHQTVDRGETWQPELIRVADEADRRRLVALLEVGDGIEVVDQYVGQTSELELVDHPERMHQPPSALTNVVAASVEEGVWVHYPWRNTLTHVLDEDDYTRLRLSRNRDLITPEEQKRYRQAVVAFAGLNVGNPAAVAIALEGGAKRMRFADHDPLTVSNLNRFRAGTTEAGVNKAILTARQVYEIDPFAEVTVHPEGVIAGGEYEFLTHPDRADVLVEETDNLPLKIGLRETARRLGIPVVMVTGNGDGLILDVERFDQEPDLPILNGHLRAEEIDRIGRLGPETSLKEKVALARDFMGAQHLIPRLVEAFPRIGLDLAGIPQLATASFLRGAVLAYVVRRVAIGAAMPSGRYAIQLDAVIADRVDPAQ
jgi:hypothetical protein